MILLFLLIAYSFFFYLISNELPLLNLDNKSIELTAPREYNPLASPTESRKIEKLSKSYFDDTTPYYL